MSDTLHFNFLLWLCFIKLIYSNHHSTIGIINVNETDQTFSQTDHYYYTELIRFNQSSPVIFDHMNKPINLSRPRPFMPLFPFIYFGEQFRLVTIFSQGFELYTFGISHFISSKSPANKYEDTL
ncbi:hypothetical protein MS3_00004694 [Schistosoma haematobium]|uniref:Uncharacterized protein n=1 Tax=Schistosoma haematobium TaxID=6185 RepID=A0A922LTF9_SCHHA|nr:hypothetical protein MS3_00004694 [Schistosoma haematobium]KAH9592950.1 hypothetical protein MS3_00004694 [Schistosoma haematobium]